MTKLIVAFCNSAKVPKNTSDIYDIKYLMANRTIVYEQRLINFFFFQHHSQDYKNFILITQHQFGIFLLTCLDGV